MNTNQLNAAQIFSIARAIACKYFPFYSAAIYGMVPVETMREPTMAVSDKAVCFYNPIFVLEHGPKLIAAVLVHEVGHLLRQHHKRFKRLRVAQELWGLWAIAIDCELNDGHPPQLPLPEGCLLPEQFGLPPHKTAEVYFKLLREKQDKKPGGAQKDKGDSKDAKDDSEEGSEDAQDDSSGNSGEGSEDAQDDSSGSSGEGSEDAQDDGSSGSGKSSEEAQDDGSSGSGEGSEDAQDGSSGSSGVAQDDSGNAQDHGPGRGHCGSCSGPPKPSEPKDGKHEGVGRSEIEIERIRDKVAQDVVQHQKNYGTGAGGSLWQWAKDRLKPPVVPWQQQLASLARTSVAFREGFLDYRDDLPSPQQGVLGWGPDIPLLPKLVAPVPEVMFLVDRSGSMQRSELIAVAQEMPGVLRSLTTPLTFGAFDTTVKEIKKVTTIDQALKLFVGGGGTDFRPIFETLKTMKQRPHVLIIGTDGDGPAPVLPPKGVLVIWLLVGKNAQRPFITYGKPISWGKFIFTDVARRQEAA